MYEAYKSINPETNGASVEDVAAAFEYYGNMILEQIDPLYLKPEIRETMDPLVKQEMEKINGWTEDQKGLAWEFMEAQRHGAEKQKAIDDFAMLFAQADATKDGLLTQDEWLAFAKLNAAAKDARGEPETEKTEAELVEFFKVMNAISPDAEGLSMMDLMAMHRYFSSQIRKLMPKQN